ncbi:MAG: hypothetical protein APF81_03465 [Desulfosporosinus sp. BRH_c37]|nr:MAG: hypothetical protein APF81_03465 [Desulfosporosinus sp. BRH_c37]
MTGSPFSIYVLKSIKARLYLIQIFRGISRSSHSMVNIFTNNILTFVFAIKAILIKVIKYKGVLK